MANISATHLFLSRFPPTSPPPLPPAYALPPHRRPETPSSPSLPGRAAAGEVEAAARSAALLPDPCPPHHRFIFNPSTDTQPHPHKRPPLTHHHQRPPSLAPQPNPTLIRFSSETNPLPHQRRCHTLPIPSLHNAFFLSRFPDGRRHSQHRHGINPFCEIAMEEELQLREAGAASEDVATTVSPGQAADTLRTMLAMGANRAVHVLHDPDPARPLLPLAVDKILRALALQETPCLLILGKQSAPSR
ncbi:atrophin-1-like [Triticum dicoccoides]|uniref:atrophin-1-like n=1 Tax=Triticum dicoccoides TaxID=85692 RepID=UPI001890ED82|nr:atrophin-1-like [Triticum dicoccoides]